jgi:type IV pilus assembly protein PilA
MICPQCRAANAPGARACVSCGAGLSWSPRPQREPRKGLAVAALVLGILSIPTLGCFVVGAAAAIIMGIVALTRANRSPDEYGGKGQAIGGIVCGGFSLVAALPVGLIVAAIAIPSLMRARIAANESAAVGDIRTMISAEFTYQGAAGVYGSLECLAKPESCHGSLGSIALIDSVLAAGGPKNGYEHTFHPGPAQESPTITGLSGLAGFAYTAVPQAPGRTGIKAFCGDASGAICYTPDGRAPGVVDGACDLTTCTPLGQ